MGDDEPGHLPVARRPGGLLSQFCEELAVVLIGCP